MCCTQRNNEQNIMTQLRIWRFSEKKINQYISEVYFIYYLINSQ